MDINLEYYKVFYYVGKLGRITLAAEELSLSQPAVSQAIKQLEQSLGIILFIRTPKGVRLTSEGQVLFSYVQQGYSHIKQGEKKLKEMMNLEKGEISIGASDMTLQFYLLSFLERFHESFPKIKVTVTNGPTPETLKYMQEGKIDFGVVSSPIHTKQEINIKQVREIEDVFVAGSKFMYLSERVIKYKELEDLPIICLEKNTSTRKYVDQYLLEKGTQLHPEFELATSDMIVQFALRNLGVACVMKDFARKYIESGELIELRLEKKITKRNFCIVTDKKSPMSLAAEKLLEMLF